MTLSRLPLRATPSRSSLSPFEIFPGIVEDVDAMVRRFGNHIVDFSLICDGGEMEAAHAQDRTFQAGLT
jgi:hypothetical protein